MKYYIIENEINSKGYRFIILPKNRHQPLGVSPWYLTIEECEHAKRKFLFFVLNNELNHLDIRYIKIEREMIEHKDTDNNVVLIPKFKFNYYDDNGVLVFYRSLGFYQKSNCLKCLNSIYNAVLENSNLI